MYQLSFSGSAHSFRTMLEVLRFLRDDASVAAVDAAKIALTFFSHPVSVTRYNGTLTVRRPGTATSLFLSLIDEIDAAYFRPSFAALEPWQIRREHWQLLYLAFELAREPLYLFSSDQVAQANEEAAKSGRRVLDLFELLQDESQRIRPRIPVVASVLDFAETSVPSGRWSAVVPGDRQQRRCP